MLLWNYVTFTSIHPHKLSTYSQLPLLKQSTLSIKAFFSKCNQISSLSSAPLQHISTLHQAYYLWQAKFLILSFSGAYFHNYGISVLNILLNNYSLNNLFIIPQFIHQIRTLQKKFL